MFHISRFLNDSSFQLLFQNNQLNIINYSNINYMEDNKISISYLDKRLLIKGNNLIVKKLLDNELLISGNIESVEVD